MKASVTNWPGRSKELRMIVTKESKYIFMHMYTSDDKKPYIISHSQ